MLEFENLFFRDHSFDNTRRYFEDHGSGCTLLPFFQNRDFAYSYIGFQNDTEKR